MQRSWHPKMPHSQQKCNFSFNWQCHVFVVVLFMPSVCKKNWNPSQAISLFPHCSNSPYHMAQHRKTVVTLSKYLFFEIIARWNTSPPGSNTNHWPLNQNHVFWCSFDLAENIAKIKNWRPLSKKIAKNSDSGDVQNVITLSKNGFQILW